MALDGVIGAVLGWVRPAPDPPSTRTHTQRLTTLPSTGPPVSSTFSSFKSLCMCVCETGQRSQSVIGVNA